MGSNAIISVLGFIIVFSIVSTTLNKRNSEAYQNAYGYADYTVARDIARNSIQIALRKIDTLSLVKNSDFPISGNLEGGSFQVAGTVLTGDSILKLTATATFSDTSYTIKTTMLRHQMSFPGTSYKGAFGIHPDSVDFTIGSKGGLIDGYDHDSVGNRLVTSPDSVASVDVWTKNDSGIVINGIKSANNKSDTTKLFGSPQILVDPAMADPNLYAGLYKSLADTLKTYNDFKHFSTVQLNGTYGSPANPVVVFCEGYPPGYRDMPFGFQGTGWGILVVHGDLTMNSNSVWHGLVILYGDDVISFNASAGNATVIGGVILGGRGTSSFKLAGGSQFLFSKSMLDKTKNMKNPYLYQVVDWYE
jgi:hypothetical protein